VSVVDYDEEFEELVICGNHAFEWGLIRCVCMLGDGKRENLKFKVLRVLQRQADGEWKVHRAIWNDMP
jgi:ketosteroid isomerase-like protein